MQTATGSIVQKPDTLQLFNFGEKKYPLLDTDAKLAIDYWNNIPNQRIHKPGTKTYQRTVDYLERLFEGHFFDLDNNGLLKYARRKFTLDDIKLSLQNFSTACKSPSHHPIDKSIFKKMNFADWIYNPYSPYKCKSLFIKYLEPPKRIQAKSNVKCHSDPMLKAFKRHYDKDLTAADLDQTKKALNKLLDIWKKIPKQFTHTTLPSNLNQQTMVKLLLTFCEETLDYFSIRLFSQDWFWTNFNRYLIEQGYLEGE